MSKNIEETEVEEVIKLRMHPNHSYRAFGRSEIGGNVTENSNFSSTAWVESGSKVGGRSDIKGTTYIGGSHSIIQGCDLDLMGEVTNVHALNSKVKGILEIHHDIFVTIYDSDIEGCLSIMPSEGNSSGEDINCVLNNVTLRGITTIHLNDFKYHKVKISDVNFQGVNKIHLDSNSLSNKMITDEYERD